MCGAGACRVRPANPAPAPVCSRQAPYTHALEQRSKTCIGQVKILKLIMVKKPRSVCMLSWPHALPLRVSRRPSSARSSRRRSPRWQARTPTTARARRRCCARRSCAPRRPPRGTCLRSCPRSAGCAPCWSAFRRWDSMLSARLSAHAHLHVPLAGSHTLQTDTCLRLIGNLLETCTLNTDWRQMWRSQREDSRALNSVTAAMCLCIICSACAKACSCLRLCWALGNG
jgi:hypothetical protein